MHKNKDVFKFKVQLRGIHLPLCKKTVYDPEFIPAIGHTYLLIVLGYLLNKHTVEQDIKP